MSVCVLGGLAVALVLSDAGVAADARGLPRPWLVGAPERSEPRLSPDGKQLAWLAPDARGVRQLWVQRRPDGAPAQVSAERLRGVTEVTWTADSTGLLFMHEVDGDERTHLLFVELQSGNVRDLTPWQGVRARLLATGLKPADRVLVEANVRDRRLMDVWRVDLRSGATELDTVNPGDVVRWLADPSLVVRAAEARDATGRVELRFRESAKGPWRPLVTAGPEELVEALGFTEDGRALILATSIDSDTTRLVEKSLKTGAERELARSPQSDVLAVLGHPVRALVRAVAFASEGRRRWTAVEPSVKADLEVLARSLAGDFRVESMDGADVHWLIAETRDRSPVRYWLWARKAKRLEALFSSRPRLDGASLAPMRAVSVPSRDGLRLTGFLTRPAGAEGPGPLVLRVHPGPWARAEWGFDGEVQLLADRGYSVLEVDFRGSTGGGKRLVAAGDRAWGLTMQADLLDAVAWAVQEGVADPKRVAVLGAGYGGYAALAGLVFSPGVFACAVDFGGPSSLLTFLGDVAASPGVFPTGRVGDLGSAEGRARLAATSPLGWVERLTAPLLVGHGANDARVSVRESEQLVAALRALGRPGARVTYVRYAGEGHQLERDANRLDWYARVERHLAACLGGRVETIPDGGEVAGTTAESWTVR